MRRALLLFAAVASIGAGYEWGGPAARGVRELKAGKSREAIASLEEARRERPRSGAVRFDQALAFQAAGQADSARAAYRDALDLEGEAARAAAAYNLGNASLNAGKFDDAIAAYRDALRREPHRADAKRNLEEALRRARTSKKQTLTGSGGTQGEGSGGTGNRQGGNTPPPPGSASSPERRQGGSPPDPGSKLGAPLPSREEAEHWLDALEAERRAGRSREQASKRAARERRNEHDW
ncbi:MAG TPA: tetratricopeptide repeat protein [Candidatus Eisenbacteria bacterium]|nr:tetratricopeptide repeat protein [Candidatus Eisenbacteria bacterium]